MRAGVRVWERSVYAVYECTCVRESMGMNWLSVHVCKYMCVRDVCMDEWCMHVSGCVRGRVE